MKFQNQNRGFVKLIIMIVIALLVLSYFGLNLRNIVNSPTGQDNFGYVKTLTVNVWNNYLKKPANYLWNDIWIPLIWRPAVDNLIKIRDGQPDSIRTAAPTIPPSTQIPN